MTIDHGVALWDAVNRVVAASGRDPGNTSVERQLAVVAVEQAVSAMLGAVCAAVVLERDQARANARILAHAYQHDSRPPFSVVAESLAYPATSGGKDGAA